MTVTAQSSTVLVAESGGAILRAGTVTHLLVACAKPGREMLSVLRMLLRLYQQ